ncbi:hypothetical protein HAZT_HAZT000744 [Hyalella azteca]|uniref:VOC domain-containing protein n=1 Tax=Hyalella azteca TaxID=294128 RepID=A0A6A0HBP9_HYAAZ|nr:hypothetical protein HAZT_HAZT000744 [Hyalella azteca]
MSTSGSRALHYVYKIGDRTATAKFYKDILGMKVLRHEEFTSGCDAACNGPYDGKWSKTMIGYGCEDDHFVCELTYNYGISDYKQGNSFFGLYLNSAEVLARAAAAGISATPVPGEDGVKMLDAPGGYKFFVNEGKSARKGRSDLSATSAYWAGLLGLRSLSGCPDGVARFSFSDDQATLEFRQIDGKVDHAKAGGRVAFSCPSSQLKSIEEKVKDAGHTILTPFISLDTPGKATVQVVILADPDGHEICFVGDEGFRELSQVDPAADALLSKALQEDQSDSWFAEHGGKQSEN